jgi:predicted secreted Zn-dependent protease
MKASDPASLPWRKSRASGTGDCVEAAARGDLVFVRDTKDRDGAVLAFLAPEWEAFLTGVRRGEFDMPVLSIPVAPSDGLRVNL